MALFLSYSIGYSQSVIQKASQKAKTKKAKGIRTIAMTFFVSLRRLQPIGNLKTSQRKKPKPRVISNGLFLSSSIGSAYRNLKTRASQVYRRTTGSNQKQTKNLKRTKENKRRTKEQQKITAGISYCLVLIFIDSY